MSVDALPNRRAEAWRYSDLRAALRDEALPALREAAHPIARLASAQPQDIVKSGDHQVFIDDMDAGPRLDARATRIRLESGASALRIVRQRGEGVALNLAEVEVESGGVFQQFIVAEGARFARIETIVTLAGAGARAELNGVYAASGSRHIDLTSHITHAGPGATTQQLIRGAARAGGRGVFQGKILVAKGAQQTDARQHHDALILEEGADINAKPELEIYADDVQCAHGNTAGALDEKALFYMRARGIPQPVARGLLIEAFLRAAIPDWLPQAVAMDVDARIAAWLEAT